MTLAWKDNWQETREHFLDWWDHKGLLIGSWGAPKGAIPHEIVPEPAAPATIEEGYANARLRAQRTHYALAHSAFPLDCLAMASTDVGPGSLALFLDAQPGFSPDTVWFYPTMQHVEEPEALPPLAFNEENHWWKIAEETAREMVALGRGKYLIGFPDLVEGVDILAALREGETLMFDMIERPEWVHEKLRELNQVYFAAFQRLYDICKLEDGSSTFGAFCLWGPGKTAKVQCDASAMFSPEMFAEFVVPQLTEQCRWLDHSMYHLDGTQCIGHLDHLLGIEELHGIEWTPQAGIEGGGDPRWYELYHRILDGGKSVQIFADQQQVPALLQELGGKGVYILTSFQQGDEANRLRDLAAKYR